MKQIEEKSALERAKHAADKAEGFLSDNEGKLLYCLASQCTGKGEIVEIGSWKGRSTIWLAEGSKAGSKATVYAVDPHPKSKRYTLQGTFQEFKANIEKAGATDIVKPIVKTSEEAAKGFNRPVELIFIDGSHEYDSVKRDFVSWFPKVVENGTIAFHDSNSWSGPKRVVMECLLRSRNFRKIRFVDSITYAKKVKRNTAADMARNAYLMLLLEFFWLARKLNEKMPLPLQARAACKKAVKLMQ